MNVRYFDIKCALILIYYFFPLRSKPCGCEIALWCRLAGIVCCSKSVVGHRCMYGYIFSFFIESARLIPVLCKFCQNGVSEVLIRQKAKMSFIDAVRFQLLEYDRQTDRQTDRQMKQTCLKYSINYIKLIK